jgi:hypothetical protein
LVFVASSEDRFRAEGHFMSQEDTLARAQQFLWLNARLMERHLFALLFGEAPRNGAIQALAAYQNPDGGFGQALEPDIRAPISQPAAIDLAFRILDLIDAFDEPMVGQACDFLLTITTPEGGIPVVLPSIRQYPHAPWWEPETEGQLQASLNPTAALAGLLHKHGIAHPWLEPATQYCWEAIARSETTEFHQLMPVLTFLEFVPDRARADGELTRVLKRIQEPGVVVSDPTAEGYVKGPLDWAPVPTSPCRVLFEDVLIDMHISALIARQRQDGGWPISWPPVSPMGELEWRGWVTLEALRTLQAYGALG